MNITIPFFKRLYKAFSISVCLTTSLSAQSIHQELNSCKAALLAQLNEQKRLKVEDCPTSQKLVYWLGILRDPNQFTPQELMTFLSTHTHWPHHEKLCKKAEDVIQEKASPTEIVAWFEKYPPQTPGGALAYANAFLALKEKTKAAQVIIKAWHTMELTNADEKKFISKFGHFLQQRDHIARLHFLLWEEDIESAKRLLSHVPINIRKAAEVRIAFLNEKSDAHQKLKALPTQQCNGEGLLYEKAKWHRKQKEFQEALVILLKAPISPTHAQKWWKERNYIARELIALQDYKTAYQLIQNHQLKPGTEDFANAEWLTGWLALRFVNRPKEAQHHFETLYTNVEGAISKARAAYWMGRTHEKQNQIDLAAKWYRKAAKYKTIYYGQLAAAKLQEKPYPILAPAPKTTAEEKKRFDQKDLVKAAHILKELGNGAQHELSKFLLHIADQAKTKGERELAVQLAHTLSPCDVVWAAKKAGYREPVALKKAFPVCAIPQRGQKIPEKALVMAVAYQESRFNPTVQSSKGATGLLQLMPKTAAKEAKCLGVAHHESKLYDPNHNLLLGSSHLSRLLNDFDSSYVLAIAAYNAGPTPVEKWLNTFGNPRDGNIDIVDWLELIPYAETRNYVMRVLENVSNYRSLEGQPKKTLIHDLKS